MTAQGARATRQQRQQLIMDYVQEYGDASVSALTALTGVSLMTVHRDIADLADQGILRKYHGGVSAQPSTVFESSSDFRLHTHTEAKRSLAREALSFVTPGMSVMLDDSTTALAVAKLLPQVGPLTVVTNYRLITEELRGVEDIRLICIGGEYSRTHDSFIGLPALEMINGFSVDVAMLSTSAMNATMTYHQEQEIVVVKRAMRQAAETSVLMMDRSKVERTALHRLEGVEAFDHVLLTGPADEEMLTTMKKLTRVRVVVGEVNPGRVAKDRHGTAGAER